MVPGAVAPGAVAPGVVAPGVAAMVRTVAVGVAAMVRTVAVGVAAFVGSVMATEVAGDPMAVVGVAMDHTAAIGDHTAGMGMPGLMRTTAFQLMPLTVHLLFPTAMRLLPSLPTRPKSYTTALNRTTVAERAR